MEPPKPGTKRERSHPVEPSKRALGLPPSGIRKFFDLANEVPDLISLGIGEPDFPTPEHIRDAAKEAIDRGLTHYTSNWGLAELREAIAEKLQRENRIEADPKSQILVTCGSSEALFLAISSIANPGDEIIIPEPSYVAYEPCIRLAGAVPMGVPTTEENEFGLEPEKIEEAISEKTKAILLVSPSNPTGAVLGKKTLEEIAKIAIEHDLAVISDEIYEKLVYEGEHTSIASLPGMQERAITINGFSKGYAMCGWRVGYLTGPENLVEHAMRIHQYMMLCAPSIAQYAALAALTGPQEPVKKMVEEYGMRRRLMAKRLNDIEGIRCILPKGAFYTFPNISSFGLSSEEFCEYLIKEARVATVPGSVFGKSGEGYVRCCYATEREEIAAAIDRIGEAVEKLNKKQ